MNTCSQGLKFAVFASSCALRARCTLAMCSPSSGRRSTSSLARCWRQQCIYPISVLQGLKLDTAAFKVLSRSAEVAEGHGLLKVDVVYNRLHPPIATRDPSSSSSYLSPFVKCLSLNLVGSSLPARAMCTPGTFPGLYFEIRDFIRGSLVTHRPLIGSELWYDQSMRLQDG